MQRVSSGSLFLLILFCSCAIVMSGCTSKYGPQTTKVNYYSQCYAPIDELRKSEFSAQKAAIGGAVGGAVLGAAVGYLSTGKASGALIGAAAGGVAGAAAGGIYGQYAKERDDAQRLAAYNSQLKGSVAEVSKVTAAAKVARQCYDRQFATAVADYKAGRINKEIFQAKYTEISSGMEEAARILGQKNMESQQLAAQYQQSLNQERTAMRQASGAAEPVQTAKRSKKSRAKAEPLKPEQQQMQQLEQSTGDMVSAVKTSQEEERLLRERLDFTRKQAADIMSS